MRFKNILIVSDIEGSSDCWSYEASSFMSRTWPRACLGMTLDVKSVVDGLLTAGVPQITVLDFHRTGFNILAEHIDSRARVVSGYRLGPVPGIGDPKGVEAVMFLGFHAASGTDGFLAHTFTSRLKRLDVNRRPMPEVEIISALLAPYGARPIFFSGCPKACAQAAANMGPIQAYPIDKTVGVHRFDAESWRDGLQAAAVRSLQNVLVPPYAPKGPFRAELTLRDGDKAARKLARRWGLPRAADRVFIETEDIASLYLALVRLCYLTPLAEKVLPLGMALYNLWGRMGLAWVRRKVKATTL